VGRGVGTADELCTYEQLAAAAEVPGQRPPTIDAYPRRNLVRTAVEDGLLFEATLGVNPFQFGFIGSTDTHNATAGNTDERDFAGGQGGNDATPARQVDDFLDTNPGGLAVVWAEENSRDALFAALRRRETYATSGARPVLRFFAGSLDGVACGAADFVERAYRTGVPMGGELGAVRGAASPRFAVLALKDPGTATRPGTDLQRVQIVKAWLDAAGALHERVVDVGGDAGNGADVDPATCAPRGTGAAELCAIWEDPDFAADERAVYYARVLENPTCRWTTFVCKAAGVDPLAADCAAQAAAADPAFADCCLTSADDPFYAPVTQERAWSSPVWYRPESIATLAGEIRFGPGPGRDRIDLTIGIARPPDTASLTSAAIEVELADDDVFFRTTLPAGDLSVAGDGSATLRVTADKLDLAAAERLEHTVTLRLTSGTYRASHARRWRAITGGLAPEPS
jgi:hypothetical protein